MWIIDYEPKVNNFVVVFISIWKFFIMILTKENNMETLMQTTMEHFTKKEKQFYVLIVRLLHSKGTILPPEL